MLPDLHGYTGINNKLSHKNSKQNSLPQKALWGLLPVLMLLLVVQLLLLLLLPLGALWERIIVAAMLLNHRKTSTLVTKRPHAMAINSQRYQSY